MPSTHRSYVVPAARLFTRMFLLVGGIILQGATERGNNSHTLTQTYTCKKTHTHTHTHSLTHSLTHTIYICRNTYTHTHTRTEHNQNTVLNRVYLLPGGFTIGRNELTHTLIHTHTHTHTYTHTYTHTTTEHKQNTVATHTQHT